MRFVFQQPVNIALREACNLVKVKLMERGAGFRLARMVRQLKPD